MELGVGVALDLGVGALKFVVDSFLQQVKEQKELLDKVPQEVDQLERDIAFLHHIKDGIAKSSSSSNLITRGLLKEVQGEIYKAEDAIDSFVMAEAAAQSSNLFNPFSWFSGAVPKLGQVAQLVVSVSKKVNDIRTKVETFTKEDTRDDSKIIIHEPKEPPKEDGEYGPIFKDEERNLKSLVGEEGEELEAIVITGMHGIGKTTLAAKIFYDKEIQQKFPNRIWVSVSNSPPENIFRSIMSLPKKQEHEEEKVDLAQLVKDRLQKEQLLIVMDDVQEVESWNKVESVFKGGNKRSKVLVTTYNDEVARYICEHRKSINLRPLNYVDSWSLLHWRVSRKHGCPKESEVNGKLIADDCGGLPLVINFVGETFDKMDSATLDLSERKTIWEEMVTEIRTSFTDEDDPTGSKKTSSILSSYNSLPYELRVCFLYLGIFPRRSTFSVSKLTRMWIAEGFIRPRGNQSLERIAEKNLKRLVDKKLVIVEDKMPNGSLKTCRMNYLFHDFCKAEAGHEKENFFLEFSQGKTDGAFNPDIDKVDKTRRFCIHTQISNFMNEFISSRPHDLRVFLHSFVSHSDNKEVFTLHGKDTSIVRAAFKLLRVLDAKPIEFKKIPTDLSYLRFVTISLNQAVLSEDICKLQNVQTLIVYTPSRTLKMKANILEMAQLRHFKTNASATLPNKSKASEKGERLQTLCGMSPKSCREKFFSKTPNLKKLGIHGKLDLLIDDKNVQMFKKLAELKKLKLLNDGKSSKFAGNLSTLIKPSQFPPSLRSLTLSATCLDWEHISILGSIENLEELKLKDNAFVGMTWNWEVDAIGLPYLQTLSIESLDFVHWESSSDHFPQLRRLDVVECKKLEKVPKELADIQTFQRLHLCNGKASAITSARDIEAKMKGTRNINLDLSIFPEDLSIGKGI